MESIDGYGGDIFGKFPCLLENKLKKEFDMMYDKATDEERADGEKMVKKELLAAFMLMD